MPGNEETRNWLVHKYACWPTMDPMGLTADVREFVRRTLIPEDMI